MTSTRGSLLGRLRDPRDEAAWQDFMARYRPRIEAWCRSKGLQEADSQNVTQEVLVRVAKLMREFVYQPGDNFSGLLRIIWRNAWVDFLRSASRAPGGQGEGGTTCPQALLDATDDELSRHLTREIELEELHEAMSRVKPAVSNRDWELFTKVDLGRQRTSQVASEYGLTVAATGMAVKRVRDRVKAMLVELRGE